MCATAVSAVLFRCEMKPWIVFAGGGTGGHLFPALAVVESLRQRGTDVDVSFFCTDKKIDHDILTTAGVNSVPLSVQPFPSRPWNWLSFYRSWRHSVGVCRAQFKARRPAAVIGAGGYASGPPVHEAIRQNIPTFLLNPDAVPGRANQYLARRRGLSGIFAQWPVTTKHFPPDAPVLITGCPVRSNFIKMRDEISPPYQGGAGGGPNTEWHRLFNLDPSRPTLLITGASQGARTINEALIGLAATITQANWQVLHLSGSADRQRVQQAYASAATPGTVLAFTDQMPEAMAVADLIVSRAGASSLAEFLAVGKPSILFPYPFHRDRHQWHNGEVLVEAGAAVMLDDQKDAAANIRNLSPILTSLMTDHARREAMARAARSLGRPDAADRVADRILQTACFEPAKSAPTSDHQTNHLFACRTA
jgi:UDP-N-acetylglucosamine--N-acetylmuramyl-(pentapeptide) pyrophosphoryl-undecaprenol N-acetylglucosamine transferase